MPRMPWERALVLALLLGSCGDSAPQAFTAGDARRLDSLEASVRSNMREVARASSALVDRVERGERRIETLESEMRDRERMQEAIIADLQSFMRRYGSHTH